MCGVGSLWKLIVWTWSSAIVVFLRRCVNTFRPTAWLLGRLQGGPGRRQTDAFVWSGAGHFRASFYSELGAGGTVLTDYVNATAKKSERILDVCCNQGRFLLDLRRKGFTDLYGFDIMGPAIELLKQSPDYDSKQISVEQCLAQDYFKSKADNSFDWAITYSATIELIHPEFDIFAELKRTIRKGMILVLDEKGHSYPRFYRLLHRMNRFEIVVARKLYMDELVLIHSVKR